MLGSQLCNIAVLALNSPHVADRKQTMPVIATRGGNDGDDLGRMSTSRASVGICLVLGAGDTPDATSWRVESVGEGCVRASNQIRFSLR